MTRRTWKQITIIGMGMIGTSLALALKRLDLAECVMGCDALASSLETAKQRGAIDVGSTNPAEAVREAELVVLATPLSTAQGIAQMIAPALPRGCVVTDVGSVKGRLTEEVQQVLSDGVVFVPGHPIAGREKSGPEAGDGALFEGKRQILTPLVQDEPAVERVAALWRRIGADVVLLDITAHDEIFGLTSHVPHLLAFAAAEALSGMPLTMDEQCATFLRIGASNPAMWADVFCYNSKALIRQMQHFEEEWQELMSALDEPERLADVLASPHRFRMEARQGVHPRWAVDANASTPSDLFPILIAAACTRVMQASAKVQNLSLDGYLGAGYMDFSLPVTVTPIEAAKWLHSHREELRGELSRQFRQSVQEQVQACAKQDIVELRTYIAKCSEAAAALRGEI